MAPSTLKKDQEPAMVDLMKSVAMLRGASRTALEYSPMPDWARNGVTERAEHREIVDGTLAGT